MDKELTLDKVKLNQKVRVISIAGDRPIKRRIMDMGITKNQIIYIKKMAPLGDPMELKVRGYELSIRKADAHHICVERVEDHD